MRKSFVMQFLIVALGSSAAWAQGIQNFDISILGGPAWNKSYVIPGTTVTLAGSTGHSIEYDYGYQVRRVSAASLMLDVWGGFVFPGAWTANVPVSGGNSSSWAAFTLGLRFLVPVSARVSFYAVADGGFAAFSVPYETQGPNPTVTSTGDTGHGAFVFGGGADLRLSRWFSLRAEVRDLVTGRELSGAGRNHPLPAFGVAVHF
ncbi:MAG: hypothetical protein WCB12_17615 [Bryobacteraceae bacterium]